MIDIHTLLKANIENMGEEERAYFQQFTEKLKDKLVEELINYKIQSLLKLAKSNEDNFRMNLESMLYNGFKGYDKMPMETLITIYLENKSQEDFMNLIQNIN